MRRTSKVSSVHEVHDADTSDELVGYEQELKRNWSFIHNFGVSFSIISVVTGTTTLFSYGLATGGPAVMSIGWVVVLFFTMFVGLGMAEICSGYPNAGGPYFWAAALAPPQYSAFFSWITGWFNFLGQVAVTTGITFGCAGLIANLATVKGGFEPTAPKTIGIYAALLISHGLLNTFGSRLLRFLNNSSIMFHSLGVAAIAIAVVAKAPTHQSAKFVFTTFNDGTGDPGWSVRASPAYVAVCGILFAQFTITGFDASAHLSEETRNAARTAPLGILTSIAVSAVFGWFLILCLLFSIQDYDSILAPESGQPVLQIMLEIFGENGAIALFTIIIICVWHCGLFSLTSNSRMMFAFSRDRGIPHFFHNVDKKLDVPVRTIWLAAFLAFCLALPSLGSSVAFTAATSIATIGLYISYIIPIMIGLIWPQHFKKGPFNLGIASRPIAFVACIWVGFIVVVFCLPTATPVTSQTLNYTPVAVGIILLFTLGAWFPWAKKWYKGPVRELAAEEAGINVNIPGEFERAEREGRVEKAIKAHER